MARQRLSEVQIAVGWAADPAGDGVAFARFGTGEGGRFIRIPFAVARRPALFGREVGYAAVTATASALADYGIERLVLRIGDGELLEDIERRRPLPAALHLPYIRARCALRRFGRVRLELGNVGDLMLRARAEVEHHAAA